ncbi:hypothetical protein OXX59_002039 [Metschnikowia pulcherrima]
MRFSRLILSGWICSLACAIRPPLYSVSPNCDLIPVKDTHEITSNYSSFLESSERCVLFQIEDSNTFLARKSKRWRNFEASVESLATVAGRPRIGAGLGPLRFTFLSKYFSVRDDSAWVEFYYDDFENRTIPGLTPVSLCHSELMGEGSVVSFQSFFVATFGAVGVLTADFDFQNFAISTAAEVTLERANAISVKVRCAINHGEIGQLFLASTQYLYFTPWHRLRVYDKKTKSFSEGESFSQSTRERRIVKGGAGDWVCATSSMTNLQCQGLKDHLYFWK